MTQLSLLSDGREALWHMGKIAYTCRCMRLLLSSSSNSPLVLFDLQAGFLSMAGISTMADALLFYKRLAHWLKDHSTLIKPQTELTIALRFINSASMRALYQFLKEIKDARIPLRIVVTHLESSDNSDVIEFFEEVCRILDLPYEVRKDSSENETSSSS